VPSTHTGGLAGLRGGSYCHPGLDEVDQRWSPRVLKALELSAAQTDRCNEVDTNGKSADQIELETLSGFFSAACRPGPWSANNTQDGNLKREHPSMCSLCGGDSCGGYSINMGVSVAGVRNENRHIQALECLRVNTNSTASAVAYTAWLHVREYFTQLCSGGACQPAHVVASGHQPCQRLVGGAVHGDRRGRQCPRGTKCSWVRAAAYTLGVQPTLSCQQRAS
ncbi:Transferin, partial [Operophtera brumata]